MKKIIENAEELARKRALLLKELEELKQLEAENCIGAHYNLQPDIVRLAQVGREWVKKNKEELELRNSLPFLLGKELQWVFGQWEITPVGQLILEVRREGVTIRMGYFIPYSLLGKTDEEWMEYLNENILQNS